MDLFEPFVMNKDISKVNGLEPVGDPTYWKLGKLMTATKGLSGRERQLGVGAYDGSRFIPWHAITSIDFHNEFDNEFK